MNDERPDWKAVNKKTRLGFTKAKYLTDDEIEGILHGLAEGEPIYDVCRRFGTSTTQWMRRIRRDPELMKRSQEALEEGRSSMHETLRARLWQHVQEGEYKAAKDMAIVLLPEWREALTTSRLQLGNVDGQAFKMAALKQYGENLSDEDLQKLIEIMEKATSEVGEATIHALPSADAK